ncbi:PAS domain-containing hybrid sensor histidine kinase/response regulator [Dethiosulfatarculus sandiegensis]|nr:response regulator [Dethiosulfatarculus sandiegensis]
MPTGFMPMNDLPKDNLTKDRDSETLTESETFSADSADAVLEALTEPAWITDKDHLILKTNQKFREQLKLSRGSKYHCCYEYFFGRKTPCPAEERACPIERVFATLKPFNTLYELISPQGKRQLFRVQSRPLKDSGGKLKGILHIMRDVTALEKALELEFAQEDPGSTNRITASPQLPHGEKRFQSLVNNLPGVIYRCALDEFWTMHYISDAVFELTGHKAKNFIGNRKLAFADSIHPEDRGMVEAEIKAALAEHKPYAIDYRVLHTSGDIKWVHERGLGVSIDENGPVVWLDGAILDITPRIKAEFESEEARRRLEQLINFLPDPTWVIDKEGRIEAWNLALEILTEIPADQMIGKSDFEHSLPFFRERRPSLLDLALNWDQQAAKSYEQVSKQDETLTGLSYHPHLGDGGLWLLSSARVLYNSRGLPNGAIQSMRDITQRVKMEESLQLATHKAKEATRAKDEFLANMSHEIRTPMNVVLGMAHLALQTEVPPHLVDYLSKIKTAANSLLRIINDILDFSKIEAGRLEMERSQFQLQEVLDQTASILVENAREKKLEFLIHASAEAPENYKGDALRLTQVLLNLCSNAIKFTEKGEIFVSVKPLEMKGLTTTLEFTVRDTGIGMSQREMNRLFRPFTQGDASITRRYGGTGLGLTISKRLVQMMGGDIQVKSKPGKGSEFIFTVKLESTEKSVIQKAKLPTELKWLRVLVVDDNQTSGKIISNMLESLAMQATGVTSGEEALKLVQTKGRIRPFELIIVDYDMPGMNGVETVQTIFDSVTEETKPHAIMVSGYDNEKMRQGVKDLRLGGPLLKPFGKDVLLDTIFHTLGKSMPDLFKKHPPKKASAPKTVLSGKVLLVEDNQINRQVAEGFLHNLGLEWDSAKNGEQAVHMVKEGEYQVVLMDIQMPIMDGLQATRLIRQNPALKDLPIIAMTAHTMSGDREKCLSAGMDDHIGKPIDPKTLESVLLKWIKGKTASTDKKAPPAEPQKEEEYLPGISRQAAMRSVGDDKELFEELLDLFLAHNTESGPSINQALLDRDTENAAKLMHSLKGTAATLGAQALEKATRELEMAIREKRTYDKLLERFNLEINNLITGIKSHKKTLSSINVPRRE